MPETLPGFDLAPAVLPASEWCQRWRPAGWHVWRHLSGATIQPAEYRVRPIGTNIAKPFVLGFHYSGRYPVATRRFGLYRCGDLVGVAAFGNPVSVHVLPKAFPMLQPYRQSTELLRFILTDDVPANGESWFLARCFEALREDGFRGIVSHSDPVPRRRRDGSILYPGHIGTIYQASNAVYAGRTKAHVIDVLADGTLPHPRALSKARNGERNGLTAVRQLEAHGATPLQAGQHTAEWLAGALSELGANKQQHAGQHRYLFALDRRVRLGYGLTRRADPSAYPKAVDVAA